VRTVSDRIEITVVYLGGSRDETGCGREPMTLAAGSTIADVAKVVADKHPGLAPRLAHVRWARNFEFAPLDARIAAADEVALLPPVCGGAPRGVLTSEPLDPAAVEAAVASPEVGATVVFVGSVRRQSHGHVVDRIEYQAYEPMASRQLERVADEVLAATGATDLRIVHRHGTLAVGELTIVIAAASPHRAQAFEACRAAIERVKVDVPIWKRELGPEGAVWHGWGGG
jgi:molybdopterin synthase catalytic subunit/molybdopterin converting factor small subunit